MNVGISAVRRGQQQRAVHHLQQALQLAPGHPEVASDVSTLLLELGRWDLAAPLLKRCLARREEPGTLIRLAVLHLATGARQAAVDAARRATELAPKEAAAHYILHQALFDDRAPAGSLAPLALAVKYDPESLMYRFCLGVALDLADDSDGARDMFESLGDSAYVGARDSWEYIKAHRTKETRVYNTTRETLVAALGAARPDGSVLEFGVRYGISTRWLAEQCELVHGFDSFEGLPENWHIQPKGAYSTHGEPPELPSNVKLHIGWFDASIPVFAKEWAGPVRFMNVDCDLYSSTKSIFDHLADRVGPGTVIVFDEYLINDRWREDEFKAFQEAVRGREWEYEYLAFSIMEGQAAVRIR
jgi:tetratricopeptide (TPR) repeat protein